MQALAHASPKPLLRTELNMAKFFFVRECPLGEECNADNFKKWDPWGWTETECWDKVFKHLCGSGHHKANCPSGDNRHDFYKVIMDAVHIEQDEYEPQQPSHKKKKRSRETDPSGAAEGMMPADADGAESRASATAVQAKSGMLGLLRMLSDSRSTSSSTAPVSRQDLRAVSDSLNRCITAARHAQRLSAMAASAFNDEAAVFEEVKTFIDAKMCMTSA